MAANEALIDTIYDGWHTFQKELVKAIAPLDAEQLALRASSGLRPVATIAAHIIGARARWFYMLMGEGGDEFKALGRWDRRGAKQRTAEDLVTGLESTWRGMHEAIARWTPEEWEQTWPGEDDSEPETITRHWVIWHLIEHDLYHGGEISLTLGVHRLRALEL